MKECISCHNKVEDLQHTCPKCGGKSFGYKDGMLFIDAVQKQIEARKYVDRGAKFAMQERYNEAERELRMAIEINPMNATAHGNMGRVLLWQDDLQKLSRC